jgi:hypothetical protein
MRKITLLVTAFALLCVITAWVNAAENRNFPDWVTHLLAKEFPDTEVVQGHREGDRDENRFEVKLKKDGRRISVDLIEEIGVVEIDEELKQFPERVLKGLQRAFPKARIEGGEKNTDIRVSYKVFITSEGRKREVRISPRGRILEIERRD